MLAKRVHVRSKAQIGREFEGSGEFKPYLRKKGPEFRLSANIIRSSEGNAGAGANICKVARMLVCHPDVK